MVGGDPNLFVFVCFFLFCFFFFGGGGMAVGSGTPCVVFVPLEGYYQIILVVHGT